MAKTKAQLARLARLSWGKRVRGRASALKVWKREGLRMDPTWLEIRHGTVARGRAGMRGFSVVGSKSTDVWNALVIVHEMTHICLYRLRHPKRKGHGQAFRGLYLAAACEFFGISEAEVLAEWPSHAGSRSIKAYDLDMAIASVAEAKGWTFP